MHILMEELLWTLLDTAGALVRPTYSNWNSCRDDPEPFDNFQRRLEALESRKLIEIRPRQSLDRVIHLTSAGRLHLLGGRDPDIEWSRAWDGIWRLIVFDLPSHDHVMRKKLTRFMTARRYGHLQWSCWLSPDPATDIRNQLRHINATPRVFTGFEGRPATGETDQDLVASAWNFAKINSRYAVYLAVLHDAPRSATGQADWQCRERIAWQDAVRVDPMLPGVLHPPGYLGIQAWIERKQRFRLLANPGPPS